MATTFYVDWGCNNDGDGGCNGGTPPNCVCAAGAGAAGPFKTIQSAANAALAPGDIIKVRGAHVKNVGEGANHQAADFNGIYRPITTITGKDGTALNPIVIEPYGWTADYAGTEEAVYFQDDRLASWTRCQDCTTGICAAVMDNGVAPDYCHEIFYTSQAGTLVAATVNTTTQIDTSFQSASPVFNDPLTLTAFSQCDNATAQWCFPEVECPFAPGTRSCTFNTSVTRYTSFRKPNADGTRYPAETPSTLFVRWGKDLPSPTPRVIREDRGIIKLASSSYWTIRGFHFRDFSNAGILFEGNVGNTSDNLVVEDCKFYNMLGRPIDRNQVEGGIALNGMAHANLHDNYFGNRSIPGIAAYGSLTVSTAYTIKNNFFTNVSPSYTMGDDYNTGTMAGEGIVSIALGENGNIDPTGVVTFDFSGTTIDGNLFVEDMGDEKISVGRSCRGGVQIKNNFVQWGNGTFVQMQAGTYNDVGSVQLPGVIENVEVFNNVLNRFTGWAINAGSNVDSSLSAWRGNTFANNTISATFCLWMHTFFGEVNNNLFVNNSCEAANMTGQYLYAIEWTQNPPNGMMFNHNNINAYTGLGALALVGISYHGCTLGEVDAKLPGDGVDTCLPAMYYDVMRANLYSSPRSPLLNAGTATGVPASRTVSIVNALPIKYSSPTQAYMPMMDYRQGFAPVGTIDVGAMENPILNPKLIQVTGNDAASWTKYVPAGCVALGESDFCQQIPDNTDYVRVSTEYSTLDLSSFCNGFKQTISGLTIGQTYHLIVEYSDQAYEPRSIIPISGLPPISVNFSALASGGNCTFDTPWTTLWPIHATSWNRVDCEFVPSAASGDISFEGGPENGATDMRRWMITNINLY